MDFTSTTKIISSKFLPEQAACLCNQIDCFTCTCGNLICCCTSSLQWNARFAAKLQLDCCFCHCHHLGIVAANGEITKVMISEKAEETMKNGFSLAWPGSLFSHTGHYCFQLIYTESNNVLRGREVWLVSHSQPSFSCMQTMWSTGKKAGYARLIKVRPH